MGKFHRCNTLTKWWMFPFKKKDTCQWYKQFRSLSMCRKFSISTKFVEVPIQKERQVPMVQTVQKFVDVPQVQYIDKVVEVPVQKERQVPMVQTVQKFVDVPQ